MTPNDTARRRLLPWGIAGALLLVAAAMQAAGAANWGPLDFVLAALLLGGAALLWDQTARPGPAPHRAAWGLAILTWLVLAWGSLAVGLLGDEGEPANLLLAAVLAVAALGTAFARLRPGVMARAMAATAAAQLLGGLAALAMGYGAEALAATALTAPWSLSAFLFARGGAPAA
jgi:hypothetical protein